MRNILLSFFILILISSSCASQKILTQYAGTTIVFGDGGGFTGQVNAYTLSTDGKITVIKSLEGDTVLFSTISKKAAGEIFTKLAGSGLDTLDFKHPGNKYYFIREMREGINHEVVWGDPGYAVPQQVENLYTLLLTKINNN